LVNNVINAKEEIAMASTMLMEISKDEQERARFRSKRMFETDTESNLLVAERRGEAKGMAKVLDLLKKGVSPDEIEKMIDKK